MPEPITILDLHMMAEVCSNLYEVRGGGREATNAFMHSIDAITTMLMDYRVSQMISKSPEFTPENPLTDS